jgi:hypothetical protein
VNFCQRFFRRRAVERRHRRHRLPGKDHPVRGDDRLVLVVLTAPHVMTDIVQIFAGEHGDDTGIASASALSIERMRACAYGLRKNFPSSTPGIVRSATYLALPVTFAAPSTRGTDWPTIENLVVAAVPVLVAMTILSSDQRDERSIV